MADIQLIQCKNQHYIKTVSGKVVAQSTSGVNILAGGSAVPMISERKETDQVDTTIRCLVIAETDRPTRIGSTCVAYTSPHRAAAVTSSRH